MSKRKKAEHGEAGYYVNHKCRCDLCKEAWRAYFKAYRMRAKARKAASNA